MARQEEGWPLGLRPLNARIGLVRSSDLSGSVSSSTLVTGSPTSSIGSSSDLDTDSTGSFFHDKSITLGNLIGVSTILDLSRRSSRRRTSDTSRDHHKSFKPKPWIFSLCPKLSTDAVTTSSNNNNNNPQSLGQFLQEERRARPRRNEMGPRRPPGDYSLVFSLPNKNSIIVGEEQQITPQANRDILRNVGAPLLFSCVCRHLL